MYRSSAQRQNTNCTEGGYGVKYKYTAEVELDADIYTAKEYLDNCMRQAVDELGESRIEVCTDEAG